MIINVRMMAFMNAFTVRPVESPFEESDNISLFSKLNSAFCQGQNELCDNKRITKSLPSVSVGDVVEVAEGNFIICPMGFHKLTEDEYEAYKNITDRRERMQYSYVKFSGDDNLI